MSQRLLLSKVVHWQPWRRLGLALIVIAVGALVGATPYGWAWEQDFGLTWLFRLRGPVDPPREVVIVTIDEASSERLGLPRIPRKWPRGIHARLVDRLMQAGASVIAFDVQFHEERDPAGDQVFAAAVRRAGNVILFERVDKKIQQIGTDSARELVIETRLPPVPVLADAALGLAPFTLPRMPRKVSQVWLFKSEAGDTPTLPVVALHVHARAAYEAFVDLIGQVSSVAQERARRVLGEAGAGDGVNEQVRLLRELFLSDRLLARRLMAKLLAHGGPEASQRDRLSALIFTYGGRSSLHLSFYGPPGSIRTIPYHRILEAAPGALDLAGCAIFIGAAARQQPEQLDGFYTTYTQETGLDVSGVEIAATAFANLLTGRPVRPPAPGWELLLLVGWGLLVAASLRWSPGGWIPAVALATGGAYLGISFLAFARLDLWLPLVTPLLVQLPVATFGALLWRYSDMQRERENIRRAFGMHLPSSAVDQLARGIDDFRATTEHAFGICLSTDAEQYTALSEQLEPATLRMLMNDYYGTIFPAVRDRGGVVADVVGDAMLAVWAAGEESPVLKQRACEAALAILDAVETFNTHNPQHRLPTRLGLHCGDLVLGYIGAVDHYEYRAVGDIVNTASRIEGLSKQLGTRLLVSGDVAAGLRGLPLRALGRFVLKGKTRPVAIYELMGVKDRESVDCDGLCAAFAEALAAFSAGDWSQALRCFEAVEHAYGQDGPSRFYLRLCRHYLCRPPEGDWNGVVKLDSK